MLEIIATGEAHPNHSELVSNEQVLALLAANGITTDKTAQDVEETIGVQTRWWSNPTTTSYQLALVAAQNAVALASVSDPEFSLDQVRLIASGGATPDLVYPAISCRLQGALGIDDNLVEPIETYLACTSAVAALVTTSSRIKDLYRQSNDSRPVYAIVAFGEVIGSQANPPTSTDCLLWGDGGGAVVLRYDEKDNKKAGVLNGRTVSAGSLADWTESIGLGTKYAHACRPLEASMQGHQRDISRYLMKRVPELVKPFIDQEEINLQRAYLLPHNANLRSALKIGEALSFEPNTVLTSIRNRGNTSSASILITLDHFYRQGTFGPGDELLLLAFGGGMTISYLHYRF